MNNRDLELFLHLSKTLNFARTSEANHVSPSSLSRVIQRIEAELGETLFERDNRRVKLTAAGHAFREYADEAINNWLGIKASLAKQEGILSGEISIFCSVTASYSFLYELLSEFRHEHPQVEIKLHTGDTATTIDRIIREDEDIGIAAIPDRLPPNLAVLEITQTPLVFIKPKENKHIEHAMTAKGGVNWNLMPMIVSETGLARQQIDHWFKAQKIKPVIYAQVAGNEAIVSMVSLGFGVGLVPQLVVENSPLIEQIEILKVAPALTPFSVGVCTLRRKLANPTIKAFWELTANSIQQKKRFKGSGA